MEWGAQCSSWHKTGLVMRSSSPCLPRPPCPRASNWGTPGLVSWGWVLVSSHSWGSDPQHCLLPRALSTALPPKWTPANVCLGSHDYVILMPLQGQPLQHPVSSWIRSVTWPTRWGCAIPPASRSTLWASAFPVMLATLPHLLLALSPLSSYSLPLACWPLLVWGHGLWSHLLVCKAANLRSSLLLDASALQIVFRPQRNCQQIERGHTVFWVLILLQPLLIS